MFVRHLFAGLFLIAGLAVATVIATGMIMSMQLDTGRELLLALAGLGGAAAALVLGAAVLFIGR